MIFLLFLLFIINNIIYINGTKPSIGDKPVNISNVTVYPTSICSKGYELNNGECILRKILDATLLCKKGKLHGGECIETKHTPAQAVCPPNTVQSTGHHGSCISIETLEPLYICSHGYEMIGNECKKIIETKSKLKCQHGFKLQNDNTCIKTIKNKADRFCPVGTEQDLIGINEINGTTLYNNNKKGDHLQCMRYEYSDLNITCPKHFEMNLNGQCEKLYKVKYATVCPKGYILGEDGITCTRTNIVEPIVYCEDGSILENKKCIKKLYNPPRYNCKKGFEYSSVEHICIKVLKEEPLVICEKNQVLIGNECVDTIISKPLYSCQNGANMINGTNMIDSTNNGTNKKGTQVNETKKCSTVDYVPAIFECPKSMELIDDQCIKIEYRDTIISCPKGFILSDDKCIQSIKVKPEIACLQGGELIGTECIIHEYLNPDVFCDTQDINTVLIDGVCVKTLTKNVSTTCSSGYTLNTNSGLCIKENKIKPEIVCPINSTLDGHGKCKFAQVSLPLLSCPKKYTLNEIERTCSLIETALPTLSCPHDFTLNEQGICVINTKKNLKHGGNVPPVVIEGEKKEKEKDKKKTESSSWFPF